jgi:YVTN family beta-propeller protein
VTVGGLNQVKVFRIDTFGQVATIPVGRLPHGIWPSGDGTRVYVGLENDDQLAVIDTITNTVIANIATGQAAQAVNYVPGAVPVGDGRANLQPRGVAGEAAHFTLRPSEAGGEGEAPTSVTLFDQGLIQILQASVTGLEPHRPYVLGLSTGAEGAGAFEPLSTFMTNPAGSAIVNTTGPIRQIVHGEVDAERRYLAIAEDSGTTPGSIVQVQVTD